MHFETSRIYHVYNQGNNRQAIFINKENQLKLADYAMKYTPRTRALVGAILKEIGLWEKSYILKESLNPITKYKIGISIDNLPTKNYWNII